MFDSIACFPLRSASPDELGTALARTYAEFNAWHGQATFIANFAQDARTAGVKSVVTDRLHEAIFFGEQQGILKYTTAKTKTNFEIAYELAEHQLTTAEVGVKIAAVVMLHNACERYLWRLIRFGVVANRSKVVAQMSDRKVTVKMVAELDTEALIDEQIEKWWEQSERDSLPQKWDSLIALVGFPNELVSHPNWYFDKKMFSDFDEVRHDAVHHGGHSVKAFDLAAFATQLSRAQLIWFVQIARTMNLKVSPESFFGLDRPGINASQQS